MEAPIAVTIGLASAASTSHACISGRSGHRMLRTVQRCFQREGMKWRRDTKPLQIRASAVAGEFMHMNEELVDNSTEVKRKNSSVGKFEAELGNANFNLGHHQAHSQQEKHAAVLSWWMALLVSFILAIEKQKIVLDGGMALDTLRRGKLVENDLVYRQTFVIRSYEAGFDKIASIETIANLFQETALNHVALSKFVGDGMGTTHAMMRHRLIWVVTRMHVEVDRYPVWGDVVEIDSWIDAEGKNGMRRDFIVRDYASGEVIARATSTWVMINQDTRRLSKMPEEVVAEISPFYLNKKCMQSERCQKIKKLTSTAPYIRSDLVPRLKDIDMNQHVNNVKYISWVIESVPQSLLVANELASMTLEYRRECTPSDVVQSLSCPDTHLSTSGECQNGSSSLHEGLDGSPNAVSCSEGALRSAAFTVPKTGPLQYTHLVRMQSNGADIVYGRTEWRVKDRYSGANETKPNQSNNSSRAWQKPTIPHTNQQVPWPCNRCSPSN